MRRVVLPLLAALASALAAPGYATTISWDTDANGDWNTAGNWSPAAVPGAADDAVIDRAGANGAPPTVTHAAGATVVQSLTNDEAVAVSAGSSLTTGAYTGGEGASLEASGDASFTATGAVSIDGSTLRALGGGQIDLPTLGGYAGTGTASPLWRAQGPGTSASRIDASGATTLSGSTLFGRSWQVEALDGGQVDLGGATSLADSNAHFVADGGGSLVDLSSLQAFADTVQPQDQTSSIEARNGGEVRLRSDPGANLSIDRYRLVREGAASTLDTSRVTSLANSTVQVLGAGTTLDLTNVGSYDTNSFQAYDGAELTLGTASYTTAGSSLLTHFFTADGASGGASHIDGSALTSLTGGTAFGRFLNVEATDGGHVDLQNVTTLADSNVRFLADGTGSLVDISSIQTFSDALQPSDQTASLEARNGGEVRLRSDPGASLSIDRYRLIREGAASTLDTSRVTSLTNSIVQVLGAGTTLDLTNLGSHDTNSFQAFDGAQLTLDTASYSAAGGNDLTRSFTADGPASQIDGSAITSLTGGTGFGRFLNVEATDGGHVDLQNVTTLADSNVRFLADGAGSVVDLSSIQAFSDALQPSDQTASLEARNGGEIRLRSDAGASLSIDRYRLIRDGAGSTLDTSRVTNLTNSTVQVTGAGMSLDLTSLGSYDTNSFQAHDGAQLTLATASYSAAGGNDLTRTFLADGAGSLIDGQAITSLTGGTSFGSFLDVQASNGGEVDLRNAATLTGNATVLANGAGSVADLRSLASFDAPGGGTVSSIQAMGDGLVQLRQTGTTQLTGVHLHASDTGTIQGDVVEALGSSRLRGEGTLAFNEVVNQAVLDPGLADDDPGQILFSGDFTQTALGVFEVDIGGLLGAEFDSVMALGDAVLAGEIHITLVDLDPTPPFEPFAPQVGDVFDVLTAASILDEGIFVAPAFSAGLSWETQVVSGAGGDTLRLQVVPEPGTFPLVALGLAASALARRRRSPRERRE